MAKLRGSLTHAMEHYSWWLKLGLENSKGDPDLLISYVKTAIKGVDKEAGKFNKGTKKKS